MAAHTEELPIEWWEYAIMGGVGTVLLGLLLAVIGVICHVLENREF